MRAIARTIYHQLVPYDLRIQVWESRQRLAISPDRIPSCNASPTERIAIQVMGKRAFQQSAFAQAVIRHTAGLDMQHAMLRTWIEYPLRTNARGNNVVRAVQRYLPAIEGKRSLDIGCAYGGTPIAFARAGADAYGLELNTGLLELAKVNLADHPGLHGTLLVGDVLQPAIADPLGYFDIITCDNVIEHVEKASVLIERIAHMLLSNGVCIMEIPNPFSYTQVVRDGHYALLGLTLLEREKAIEYFVAAGHTDPYGVGEYCFTLADYTAMFSQVGLEMTLINAQPYHPRAVEALKRHMASLRATFISQVHEGTIPASVRVDIEQAIDRYLREFDARYTAYRATPTQELGNQLLADYQQDQWQVLVRHHA